MRGYAWHAMVSNPFAQPDLPMQRSFYGEEEVLAMLDMALEDVALSSARMVKHSPCLLVIYEDADEAEITERVARLADIASFTYETERLVDIDWAARMQEDFPAFHVGRFFVHGSHHKEATPAASLPICIDAAAAFGTGEHATTAGCLRLLQRLHKHRRHAPRILDMGCGTAILAIGAAQLWPYASVDAVDNDAAAVKVAAHNVVQNNMHTRMRAWQSEGPRHPWLHRRGPYDVVIANILARPLMDMACDLCTLVAPGGSLILSGLLDWQMRMVLAAYRMQGFTLQAKHAHNHWMALLLSRS